MANVSKQDDDLEGLLVGILGLLVVLAATVAAYFFIANSAPRAVDDLKGEKLIWTIAGPALLGFGCFLYGLVGLVRGRIVIGWGTYNQVRTTLTGTPAFVAACSTAIGGLLLMTAIAMFLFPQLALVIHPLGALLCGLLMPALGWICAAIIRSLGY